MKGKVIETKEFSKEIKLIRAYSIIMKDEHGQVIYSFDKKKKADEFYENLKSDIYL